MALYNTFEEAKLAFNQYFFNDEGQLITDANDDVNDPNAIVRRDLFILIEEGDNTLRLLRLGSQLQFLAALGKEASDRNDTTLLNDVISAYEYRVEKIWSQRKFVNDLKILSGEDAIGRSGPGHSMFMIGLLLAKGNGFYNLLENSPKIHLDALIERIVPSQIDSLLYNTTIKSALDDSYGDRTFYEAPNGDTFPVAPYSINGAAMVAGVLGMYSNFVWRPDNPGKFVNDFPHRSLLANIINKIKDRYTKYDASQRALISIGGVGKNAQKICPSSGYNSLVAMGSSLAAHGTVWTTGMEVPSSAFVTYARRLNSQFEYSLIDDNKAYELSTPFDFTGSKMTYQEYKEYAERYNLNVEESDLDNDIIDGDFEKYFDGPEGVGLHTEPTVYLYTSSWTGDEEFIYSVDRALRRSGEIGSFSDMSALRASLRYGINEGSSHRALTGFAGALSTGITEVSDGLI